MRLGRIVVSIFCLVFSSMAFAVGSNAPRLSLPQKTKILGLVRVEDNQVKCVTYAENVKVDYSRLQIPLCKSEGQEADQNQAAMMLAKSGGQVRTAFVSHLAAALGGCVTGMLGSATYIGVRDDVSADSIAKSALVAVASGTVTTLSSTLAADPTLHLASGAVGALVCGGTLYLILDSIIR